MSNKKIALIGSGELARRLITYVNETGFASVKGMFDDFETKGSEKNGYPILGPLAEISELHKKGLFDEIMIAVGYKNFAFRKAVFERIIREDIPVTTYIHPTAHISESATVGTGSIVLINCIVEMNSRIGNNVFLSSASYISHDVIVGDHTYCAPSINMAGKSIIGECCFLGINTTTINGMEIGDNVISGAGSVITKPVSPGVLVAGVPATVKKQLGKK